MFDTNRNKQSLAMSYGKIIDNYLSFQTYIDLPGNGRIICPNASQYLEHGFKEVVYSEIATLQENQGIIEEYEENESQIKVSYKIVSIENNII